MTEPASVLRLRTDITVEEFDDALLLWDEQSQQLHHLDLSAALIWDALSVPRRLDDVAADLARDFPGHESRVLTDVTRLAQRLLDAGLAVLGPDVAELQRSTDARGLTPP